MRLAFILVWGVVFFLVFAFIAIATSQTGLPVNWEKCVVRIDKERRNEAGVIDTVAHGTGFFFNDDTLGLFLVTNRHILKGRDFVFIRYNKANFDHQRDTIRYHRELCSLIDADSITLWKGHPDIKIDVAAVQIQTPKGIKVDYAPLDYSRFKNFDSLKVGEDVFFFGFPLSVAGWEGRGDFPILRSGIISFKVYELTSIVREPLDSTMFLVDGFSFRGNSGSPVLTKVTRQERAALAGIITGHVPLEYKSVVNREVYFLTVGDTVFVETLPDTVIFEQNTGLAKAISADRIKETLEQFRKKE